jgi:protease II
MIIKQVTLIPELASKHNPETNITEDDCPPIFIQHGSIDNIIPRLKSVHFATKLESVLGPDKVFFELLQDAGHGGPEFDTPENISKVLDFLDKH